MVWHAHHIGWRHQIHKKPHHGRRLMGQRHDAEAADLEQARDFRVGLSDEPAVPGQEDHAVVGNEAGEAAVCRSHAEEELDQM